MSDIDTEVAHRRARLGDAALTGSSHKWGLALSGGGIRSATFCFGLLSALARQGALLRFDLLSTVSGGGYIGAMLGRLFGRAQSRADLDRIQNEIAGSDSSWFVWWLRANGRYLIPRGALDRTFAVALYLRNLAGVHLELGLMSVLVGLALTALNLAVWQGMAMLGYQTWPSEYFRWAVWLPKWLPVSWLFLPVVALFAGVYASAYWAVPWVQPTRRNGAVWVVCLGVLVASAGLLWLFWLYGRPGSETGSSVRDVLWSGFGVFVVVWVLGVRTASTSLVQTGDPEPTPLQADKARNRLTRRLAVCFRVFIVIVAVGAADRMAWYLAFDAQRLVSVGVYLAMAAAVLRAVLPLASNLVPGRNSAKSLMAVGHILGFMLAFLLFAWWVSLVHKSVLGAMFFGRTLAFSSAWIVWALFLAPVLGYIVLTGRNLAFLNLSSLHSFYRARLIRGYLGAANGERFGSSDALGALDRVPAALPVTLDTASVNKVWLGDDVSLEAYRPQDAGGPVHLINVCVNQTKDPRGQLFNQDRRGLPLTVASGGQMQVSQDGWTPLKGQASMTLGTWTAISGAAVAPGLGSLTRGGIAALATFAGLRLGYWWSKAERTNQPDKKGVGFLAKSSGLLDEMLAVFKGKEGPDWFLTDGGHFENTGAYALLAERTEVVVVADCGADPDYAFGDIENLVRKARIDLQAEIQFQRPRHAPESDTPDPHQPESPFQRKLKAFGSLQQLASNASNACLALAKITYGGADKGQGILIVIKPNMCRGLPIDLQNFKKQSPDFPQETTADQFFSEAQWEGYFLLGQILGKELDQLFIEALLEDCNKDAPEYFVYDDCSVEMSATGADGQNGKKAPEGRLIGSVTAVGASIGLGAAATLGVSAWQAIDSVKESRAKQISNERAALDEITKLWAALPPKDSADFHSTDRATSRGLVDSFGKLAGALVRTADTLCPAREADWFNQSVLARRISRDAVEGCGALPAGTRSQACDVLVEAANPNLRGQLPACLSWAAAKKTALPPPRYWAYDYSNWARVDDMHPCSPFRVQLLQDEATHEKDFGRLSDPQSRSEFADDDDKKGDKVEKPCPNPAWKGSVNSDREKLGLPPISPDVATLPPPPPPPAPAPAPAAPPAPPPPVAAPSPAAEPGPTEAGKRVIAEGQDRCRGITVYVQVYDGTQRAIARDYREPWRTLGASVPPIEDVTESARKSGRPVPQSISRTTVRFHDQASIGCAVVLGPVVGFDGWAVEALSPNLKAANRTIEVWIASPKK